MYVCMYVRTYVSHPVDSTVPSDFTYADDSCFCCVLRNSIGVAAVALGACAIVADVLMRRGMIVNWDRGKSAALVEIRGALSKSARLDMFLESGSEIAIPGTACVLHLEWSCVHLGSDLCAGGSMAPWALLLLPGSVRTPRPCPR